MMNQELSYQDQIAVCMEEIEELKCKLAEYEKRKPQEQLEHLLMAAQEEAKSLQEEVTKNETVKKELW